MQQNFDILLPAYSSPFANYSTFHPMAQDLNFRDKIDTLRGAFKMSLSFGTGGILDFSRHCCSKPKTEINH